jgi:uncharacterized membrane protein YbaN (DUF454 family)
MNLLKITWITLGSISLLIGIIGIVVPGLPTTPFILLSAGFYIRSSDKLYQKLISNQFIGSYIMEYQTQKGMTLKAKITAIGTMWFMITVSTLFFISTFTVKVIVILIGLIGTVVMGFIVPTARISK